MVKSRCPVIVSICGDPGGSRAIAPVVAELQRTGGYRLCSFAYGQAPLIWSHGNVPLQELDESTTTNGAKSILKELNAKLLLTATSLNGVDLEKRFIRAARKLFIPSLVVLDFWSNYVPRFSNESGHLTYLPDRIAVMDEWALSEMVSAGFPQDLLMITGQPALDNLESVRKQFSPERRASIRARLGISGDGTMVLFASQPLARVLGDSLAHPLFPGFTEKSVLAMLIHALERIAKRKETKIDLVVRPHPRENKMNLQSWKPERIRLILDDEIDGREIALASDIVTGMTTMLLVEASFLGCIVVSLQPGLTSTDIVPTNRTGLSRAVYNEQEIEPAMESLLFDEEARQHALRKNLTAHLPEDATQRVVKICNMMLTENTT